MTDGRLIIEIAPPGAIVPVGEMLTAVERGTLDFAGLMYAGYYTGIIPEADVEIGLPYAWEVPEEMSDALYNWGLEDEFVAIYAEHNIWPHIFPDGALYHFGTNFPIASPDAVKGKKLRALGIYGKYVQALGGSPVSIPKGEVYMAMKLGTIDGYLMGPSGLEEVKLKEVTDYYVVDPNTNTIGANFLFNLDSLNALPADIRELIQSNAKYVTSYFTNQFYTLSRWILYSVERQGYTKAVSWSEADKAKVRELSIALWDDVAAKSPRCARLVEIVRAQAKDMNKIK